MKNYQTSSCWKTMIPSKFKCGFGLCLIIFTLGIRPSSAMYRQTLILSDKRLTVRQIFKAIKSQTGFDVIWKDGTIDINKYVNLGLSDPTIEGIIQLCLQNQNPTLSWLIRDNSIVIRSIIQNHAIQDSSVYKGVIQDENGKALAGATIKIRGTSNATYTNSVGLFSIYAGFKDVLDISYVGYLPQVITLSGVNNNSAIKIKLIPGFNTLGEVSIVSTGYQELPRERATGSFENITKEQLQHSTDPNLLKRLEGITTSMDFNNNLTRNNSATSFSSSADPSNSPLAKLTIRGKNTLNNIQTSADNQSGRVLVVIDGIASPYPIDNVNPNDVESISVLKDAASASIWGARAANGVIVIKTKRGSYQQPLNISFNGNYNISDKLNLFSKELMSTGDYVDAQIYQFFAAGTRINNPVVTAAPQFISPVSAILGRVQNGKIAMSDAMKQLSKLRDNDVRKDFTKYIIRKSLIQSYSLGVNGGNKAISYRVSLGYDKSLNNSIVSENDRLNFNGNTSFKITDKIELSLGANYTSRRTANQAPEGAVTATVGVPFYPYTKLADTDGTPLSIPYRYHQEFLDLLKTRYGSAIQDLTYTPLTNISEGSYRFKFTNLNFNVATTYKITDGISFNAIYNYGFGNNEGATHYKKNSFYTRNLVTLYTNPNGTQVIPNDGILTPTENSSKIHSARSQINFAKIINVKHAVDFIGGMELTQTSTLNQSMRYYGYNERTLVSNNQLDFRTRFPMLFSGVIGSTATIPYVSTVILDSKIRTISAYANAAYTFDKRYTVSGSIRKDMSSEFGYRTNKGGTPFYSFGGKWDISKETFYPFGVVVPNLQLRATYGYNGNVNPLVSARQLINYSFGIQDNNLLSASTDSQSATNPLLRPEKTGIFNLGLDFGFKNNRINMTVEYYDKKTTDLIASNTLDPSTGFNRFSFNTADMHSWGSDLNINTLNVTAGRFSWRSTYLFSYNRVKVVKLFSANAKTAADVVTGFPVYNEGADLSRLYAYRWAGLDPSNGLPRGYYNGFPLSIVDNNTYFQMSNQSINTAKYFGSAVPVYFGSLRNTFQYSLFALSFNIMYKFGYYFRRPTIDVVNYSALFNTAGGNNGIQGAEFARRWQQKGDELKTNVPSMVYPAREPADTFYAYSEINVLKADHVRLQEINLSYTLNTKKWAIKNPRFFANITNLGILWRSNELGLDPDISDYPNPKTYSIGFSANF